MRQQRVGVVPRWFGGICRHVRMYVKRCQSNAGSTRCGSARLCECDIQLSPLRKRDRNAIGRLRYRGFTPTAEGVSAFQALREGDCKGLQSLSSSPFYSRHSRSAGPSLELTGQRSAMAQIKKIVFTQGGDARNTHRENPDHCPVTICKLPSSAPRHQGLPAMISCFKLRTFHFKYLPVIFANSAITSQQVF